MRIFLAAAVILALVPAGPAACSGPGCRPAGWPVDWQLVKMAYLLARQIC